MVDILLAYQSKSMLVLIFHSFLSIFFSQQPQTKMKSYESIDVLEAAVKTADNICEHL